MLGWGEDALGKHLKNVYLDRKGVIVAGNLITAIILSIL